MGFEVLLDEKHVLSSSKTMQKYHRNLLLRVVKGLETATQAREKGLDPSKEVEIYVAQDVASRTEGLVGPKGIAKRLRDLSEKEGMNKDTIVIQIAKEIAKGDFISGSPEKLAEQALRTALSYQTEGITAAPIEGIGRLAIKSNIDGSQYLAVYYSGPIRSAGGTSQGVSVFVADVIRKELGLSKYLSTEEEANRMLEEVRLYNRIMHLQLPTSDEEIIHAWRNIPIMISGDPTEKEEVGGYRNIDSMDTNRVRGGACLVLNDGLVGRAQKIMKRINKLKIEGWGWLDEIATGKFSDKREEDQGSDEKSLQVTPDYSFASDALMGRPTFSGPTSMGGFRLRYGHARNTGIAGIGVHPAVMAVVNDYLASGTHVRTERPGKGSIVTPVDSVKPPIVLLKNGDAVEVTSYDYGAIIRKDITKILFLGDMIIGFGEFLQNDYRLCPPGYVEEWWLQELQEKGWENPNMNDLERSSHFSHPNVKFPEILSLSQKYSIPLHPSFTPAWKYLSIEEIKLLHHEVWKTDTTILNKSIKFILEKCLIPHIVTETGIDVSNYFESLKAQLPNSAKFPRSSINGLEFVKSISTVNIRDIIGTTIGARMGRPEKAKERKMKPQLNGLFPLSTDKTIRRSLRKAMAQDEITIHVSNRWCESCKKSQYQTYCNSCSRETQLIGRCISCGSSMDESPCDICGAKVIYSIERRISISERLKLSYQRLGQFGNIDVKFLDKVSNQTATVELIEKGILRAKYDLNVFRDGTVRYDATDAPLTHFYPFEIDITIEKLLELGYNKDILGRKVEFTDQLIELKPQDIILHKSAIKHLTNVANFVDDCLEKIYGLDRYYSVKDKLDLMGLLVIGLAPHTSAGVIGRIIGFNDSSVCWAHPYWHSAKRRNCDGDEDGVILLLDGLLNFSKLYLPTTRGSKMDTPLVLVATLNPNEVDDEAFNLDRVTSYPLEFYESANQRKKPQEVAQLIQRAEDKLGTPDQFEGFQFSHHTSNISDGPLITRYKNPKLSIRDKLNEQLALADMIVAVDETETALKILEKHILPDLIGNLRAFASQKVRCVTCNSKYRRVPLSAKCINQSCPKSNLVLTVPPKGVTKYFDLCENIVKRYSLGIYHENRLEKLQIALESHFSDEGPKQLDLSDWF